MAFDLIIVSGNEMLIGDFQSKLRKLDPNLYVRTDDVRVLENGLKHAGVYYKQKKQAVKSNKVDRLHASSEQQKYLNALEKGELDFYVCGICIDILPEYDIINTNYGRIVSLGWRTVLLRLVEHKITTLEKARKVFNCSSLGESDFDKANFHQKLAIIKKLERKNA